MPDGAVEEWFVRQIRRNNHISNGAPLPPVFQDGHERLSFHRVPDGWSIDDFIKRYHCAKWSRNGDLVGIVVLNAQDFRDHDLPVPSLDNAYEADDDFYSIHHSCAQIIDVGKAEDLCSAGSPVNSIFTKRGHDAYYSENCTDYDGKNPLKRADMAQGDDQ